MIDWTNNGLATSPEALMEVADTYKQRAYAPYSRFRVGAALLMRDGAIFGGCNVENASYGLSVCAERSAMASAVSAGNREPLAIAVSGDDGVACSPCGACRQFLAEFNPGMDVLLMQEGVVVSHKLSDLLPLCFMLEDKSNS